jgi:hypothetical protein
VERAIFRMSKGEHDRLYLKGKATQDMDQFHIPSGASVQYDVIVTKLERVSQFLQTTFSSTCFRLGKGRTTINR